MKYRGHYINWERKKKSGNHMQDSVILGPFLRHFCSGYASIHWWCWKKCKVLGHKLWAIHVLSITVFWILLWGNLPRKFCAKTMLVVYTIIFFVLFRWVVFCSPPLPRVLGLNWFVFGTIGYWWMRHNGLAGHAFITCGLRRLNSSKARMLKM